MRNVINPMASKVISKETETQTSKKRLARQRYGGRPFRQIECEGPKEGKMRVLVGRGCEMKHRKSFKGQVSSDGVLNSYGKLLEEFKASIGNPILC